MKLYRHFLDGVPVYLARYYWWAYLWRFGLWLFDHQTIINLILFGQYRALLRETLARSENGLPGRILQLTCVYGEFTQKLLARLAGKPLHLADVADVQLELARRKSNRSPDLLPALMNAESLAYANHSFATVIIFFLMHEMPPEARKRTLSESLRVLENGGRLLVTEYGALPRQHWLYRFPLSRFVILRLEPFLDGFWREDLTAGLAELAGRYGKSIERVHQADKFGGFYRVVEYQVTTGAAE